MADETKKNWQEFVRDGIKNALEPFGNVEKELKDVVDKITHQKPNVEDLKKQLSDLLSRLSGVRKSLERAFEENVAKTLAALNLPTRKEVSAIAQKVRKLETELKKVIAASEKGAAGRAKTPAKTGSAASKKSSAKK